MTTSTSVHSNAFNFMSFLQNGVDPRTGQYTVSITLPEVKTNGLRGPGLPLVLSYNPLNTQDSGFGLGWNLQLTQYDPGRQILFLSSGETFKVTSASGDTLVMAEKKIDSFHFYKQDDTHYRVVHKSGLIEVLEVMGNGINQVALPKRIFAPEGHSIVLDYDPFNTTLLLKDIRDDSGQVLLEVKSQSTAVEVSLNSPQGPAAKFVMTFSGAEKRVSRITLPTENAASWRFDYLPVFGHTCMSRVDTPTGGHEQIFYTDGGHVFPDNSGRTPLPRVTRHINDPGMGQPSEERNYTYERGNFLGLGLTINWSDDGLDNLYQYSGEYAYVGTETLGIDPDDVQTIKRIFNQFHLLTEEVTTRNESVQTSETTYGLLPGRPFDAQPNDCQLPKEVTTRWHENGTTRQRSEKVFSSYDNSGNLTRQTEASGVVQENTWYPATASDGCPADPDGFVRQLKQQTVTPAASAYGAAPTLCTRYRYKQFPPINDSERDDWLTIEQETGLQLAPGNEVELQRTTYEYIDDPDDAFGHGRVQFQVLTMGGQTTTTDYVYSTLESPDFGESVQHTVQTVTGFDGSQKIITLEHSMLTGEPLLNRDDNDVEIRYLYDNLRRVLRETVAPCTDFEAYRRYEYYLCASTTDQAEQWLFDVKGVKTCTRFDGLNRAVYEERDDADNPARASEPRQTYAALYDGWGRLAEETEYDWLDDLPQFESLALKTTFEYDDWGAQRCSTGPDGVKTFEETDPIGSDAYAGPIQRSWTEGTGSNPVKSGVTETWSNLFEKPTRTERVDLAGKPISLSRYHYDGLGRTVEEIVGFPAKERLTVNAYDAFDRLTSSTLPGNAIVRRTYASHSSEDLPTLISVEHGGKTDVLGEQQFDGLDRLIKSTTGGRERVLAYEPGQLQPSTVTTPSGQAIGYDYTLPLGSEPLQRRLPGVTADYGYDLRNALLVTCVEQGEALSREYYSTHELKTERRSSGGTEYTMHYRYSRLGRLLAYTDVLGQEQTCDYDPQGRLRRTVLGTTTSLFTYDTLGRTASITTSDSGSGQHVAISLEYDDFSRETLRTFDLNGVVQTMLQAYDDVDDMSQRTLKQGAVDIRDEEYTYDTRGRLTQYACKGTELPVDPYGNTISQQIFTFDGIDNLTLVMTTSSAGLNRAIYRYENSDDPAQLSQVTNTGTAGYPSPIPLDYDPDGNLTLDEASRTLVYDALGRLIEVGSGPTGSEYRYDPLDKLSSETRGGDQDQRFYRDDQLANRLNGTRSSTFMRGADSLLAELQGSDTLLLGVNDGNSVLSEVMPDSTNPNSYSAYGHRSGASPPVSTLGFNGEMVEPVTGWQLLGNGYRAYNPLLMRFHSPDSLSPFGEGGVNAYAYCEGDPVNFSDADGHSLFTPFKLLARMIRPVLTTHSKVATGIPQVLRPLEKGKQVTMLKSITQQDVSGFKKISDYWGTAEKSSKASLQKTVDKLMANGFPKADIENHPAYARRIDKVREQAAYAKKSENAYSYARDHVGQPGITRQGRRAIAGAVRGIKSIDLRAGLGEVADARALSNGAYAMREVRTGINALTPSSQLKIRS